MGDHHRRQTQSPSPDWIQEAPYVELLALLKESNLPPGGLATVRRLVQHTHLRPGLQALHAGCNAGFLSREIHRRTGCQVIGIDISPDMSQAANHRAELEGVSESVVYRHMDMRAMEFGDAFFDVVFSGGALAFVDGHEAAIKEWVRVVKPHGLLANAEFYYRDAPPDSLREQISQAIGVDVPCYDREYWLSLFRAPALQKYYLHESKAVFRSSEEVSGYCRRLTEFSTPQWDPAAKHALQQRLLALFSLFNENMRYLNSMVFVYRRSAPHDEPMLYA